MSEQKSVVDWPSIIAHSEVQHLIALAIREDVGSGDVTTQAIFEKPKTVAAKLMCRTPSTITALAVGEHIWRSFDRALQFRPLVSDGACVDAHTAVADIVGDVRALLTGERTALNFMMRLCGIATAAHAASMAIPSGSNAKIYDTRKTLPGWRQLDKAAVKAGGAENHRFGLYDAVLIKDNHVASAGSVAEAIKKARALVGTSLLIEVEVDDLEQLDEALAAKPDMILLDNFSCEDMRAAVLRTKGQVPLEASGGVTQKTIKAIAETGVDRISMGALTHSALPADLALDFVD